MLLTILKLWLSLLLVITSLNAQKFIKNEKLNGSLKDKFTKVFNTAKESDNYWIGYSIERKDKKVISAGSFFVTNDLVQNIGELIEGKISYEEYSKFLSGKHRVNIIGHSIQINNNDEKETDKRTALLFRYDSMSNGINDIAETAVCNFNHSVDLDGYPLIWLGESGTDNSAKFLIELYETTSIEFVKEELVPLIGVHNDQASVTPFLKDVFYNSTNQELREDVIFWIGLQNNKDALEILKEIVKNEKSDFGERAVFAMTNIDGDEALNEIIRLAKSAHNRDVREHAIYALGNKAVKKAKITLKDFIEKDPDLEIKKSAIYALTNSDNNFLPYLIELAKTHPSLEIRKAVIYSISNYEDEKAVDALIDLVYQ